MLRVFAALVIGFFVVLWASGNNPVSLRDKLVNWADSNSKDGGGAYSRDWGKG